MGNWRATEPSEWRATESDATAMLKIGRRCGLYEEWLHRILRHIDRCGDDAAKNAADNVRAAMAVEGRP